MHFTICFLLPLLISQSQASPASLLALTADRRMSCSQLAAFNTDLNDILHTRLPNAVPPSPSPQVQAQVATVHSFITSYQSVVNAKYSYCALTHPHAAESTHNLATRQDETSIVCQILEIIFGEPEEPTSTSSEGGAVITNMPMPQPQKGTPTVAALLPRQTDLGGVLDLVKEILFGIFGCGTQELV
ncbi:hypothetical protein BJY04DRAFT_222767 [Aspergillus karnatakaensis]|uniref:uncharacterized protein n=1 Tax=Aspergillus karnatakaensis TaxID=1810916 RepID=UPI003CCDE643